MIQKIWLQPLGKFFFGGESSFKEGNEETRRSTYVLHSRYFPQQTSALGLVRNQLLLQNGLLRDNSCRIYNRSEAAKLIGNRGFTLNRDNEYGIIKRISPVYIANESGQSIPIAPLDDLHVNDNQRTLVFNLIFDRPVLQHINSKVAIKQMMYNSSMLNTPLDEAFARTEQVGINKAARPDGSPVEDKDDEAGYYYQTYFSKSDKSGVSGFVFYVEYHDNESVKLKDALVEFGGERSTFLMKVEDEIGPDFPTPSVAYKHTKIVNGVSVLRILCLSPCFVDMQKLRSLSKLIVSETISFRFFETNTQKTTRHQTINRTAGKNVDTLNESGLYHLLDRGSVIYFDPIEKPALEALFRNTSFTNIGYNKYSIL